MSELDIMRAMAKLSRLQRDILCWLLDATERIERTNSDYAKRMLEVWGIEWKTRQETRSDCAVFSRSLRRLEERGLVLRTNRCGGGAHSLGRARESKDQPHDRTTHVKLTELGREVTNKLRNG